MLPNKLTLAQVRKTIEANLGREESDKTVFMHICSHLECMEGKRITRAIAKHIEFDLHFKLSQTQRFKEFFEVMHKKTGIYFSLGKYTEFTIDKFKADNVAYSKGTEERIIKLREVLRSDFALKAYVKLSKQLLIITEIVQDIDRGSNTGSFENPAHYDLIRAMNIDNDILSALRFFKGSK